MTTTEPVSFEVKFGCGAASAQLGLIALSTDETTECDFHKLLPKDSGVMFYTSRIEAANPITVENQKRMGSQLQNAASLILPDLPLAVVAFSCTSGTMAIGYDEVCRQIKAGIAEEYRDQVRIVTPLTAALEAFERLNITKLAMLTPYIDSVNQPLISYFKDRGVNVVRLKSLFVESDIDIARIDLDSIKRGAIEASTDEADAVFLSCTAMRSVECIEELEAELGKPVLSSTLCMFWQLMRAVGYEKPIKGFGQLLESYI